MKCPNVNHGLKFIAALSLVFSLSVSTCFASAGWVGLMEKIKAPTEVPSVAKVEEKESLETQPTESSSQSEAVTLEKLQKDWNELKEVSTDFDSTLQEVEIALQEVKEAMAALEPIDAIGDEIHKATMDSLNSTLKLNKEQADKIALLEKSAETRPFALLGANCSYNDGDPTLSFSGGIGMRFGNHIMVMGELSMNKKYIASLEFDKTVDNITYGVKVGWMF